MKIDLQNGEMNPKASSRDHGDATQNQLIPQDGDNGYNGLKFREFHDISLI